MDNKLAILEGLLFLVGDEGITIPLIKEVLNIEKNEVVELLNQFKVSLDNESRGLTLVCFADKYKLCTKAVHHEYYQRLVENPISFSFSNAALETLAILAYNQPLTRLDIEKIRGVNSDNIIRKLLAKSLIKEVGRKDSVGRPMLYEVTSDFLDYFNLTSLEELPPLNEIEIDEEDIELFNTRYHEEGE